MVRAVQWIEQPEPVIRLLDQTALPLEERHLDLDRVDDLVAAIQRLSVRGAPALGTVGGLGVAMAMHQADREGWDDAHLGQQIDRIRNARPTAVNLAWAVDHVRPAMTDGIAAVLQLARQLMADDEAANRELSRRGADWILSRTGCDRPRVVTHCNTGALATSAWGTAHGIIRELHDRGRLGLVHADETRPLLQGARLTSWELGKDGIDHVVQVDGAAPSTILRGLVDVAIIGSDRIVANGDVANKIGSVSLALACARAGIPFVVAAPFSTVDLDTKSGADVVIEERDGDEVVAFGDIRTTPPGTRGFNPAFDVTPHDLVTAIVTERGIVEPAASTDPDLLARLA